MSRKAVLVINAKEIAAMSGDLLLDAAMGAGIMIPHDCSSGQCDTCRVRIYGGSVDPQGTQRGDTVLACQARVTGDAVIEFDAVPDPIKVAGVLSRIDRLSPEILEITVSLSKPFTYLPGQYVKCSFAGFPPRDYSPTQRVDGGGEIGELVFHMRRLDDGIVSSQLGRRIAIGHKVGIHGPFGSAFHRLGEGRIVLVATGTGWAPVWAIARASRFRQPGRDMVVVAGTRHPADLYMTPSLTWLTSTGVTLAIATASGLVTSDVTGVMSGRTTSHLPPLDAADTVYAAGNPAMVAAIRALCDEAGATCYADPFTASQQVKPSIGQRLFGFFSPKNVKRPPSAVAPDVAPP